MKNVLFSCVAPGHCTGLRELILETVYELAVLGKVFEIQAYVERLEAQDARYQPFARKIWALAQAFEDRQIAALVNAYVEYSET